MYMWRKQEKHNKRKLFCVLIFFYFTCICEEKQEKHDKRKIRENYIVF